MFQLIVSVPRNSSNPWHLPIIFLLQVGQVLTLGLQTPHTKCPRLHWWTSDCLLNCSKQTLRKQWFQWKKIYIIIINHRTLWNLVLNTAFHGPLPPTILPQLYHILEQDPHPGRGLLLLHQYFHFLQNILYNHVLLLPTESNLKITFEIIQALNWTLIEPLSGLVVQVLSDSCQQPWGLLSYRIFLADPRTSQPTCTDPPETPLRGYSSATSPRPRALSLLSTFPACTAHRWI